MGRNDHPRVNERAANTAAGRIGLQMARERANQYRLLFELNPCPMWICAEKTLEFLDVNEAALRLYGWSRKEFLRMTAKDIHPREDVPKLHRVVAGQRKSRAAFVGEWRQIKPDGTIFDVVVTMSLIPYAGRPARLVLVNDITERRRAEAQLKESCQRLSGIVESAMDAIVSVDEQQRIIMFNSAAERMFGLPAGKAMGLHLGRLIPKRFRHFHAQHVHDFDHTGVTARQMGQLGEIHGLRANGEKFPIEASISQVEVAGRKTFTAILRDITERKRAEQQLKELNATLEQRVTERTEEVTDANNRLRAIMDNALVGVLALNERGFIETLNSAAARIFGYSPKEMLGCNVGDFMASPHQAPGDEFLGHYTKFSDQRFMAVGRQVLGRRKDGQVMMIELTMSDFIHDGKREFVAMVRDITERKRLERELLEISERERQRIGHDLHDGLGQQLHGLSYLAALVEKNLQEDGSPRAPEVGKLNNYLGEALELTRSLARGLQPVKPVPQGLMLALHELAERTRAMYRVDCRLECRAPVLIHRHTAANHLYRIAQEAVNNAMKHGKPTRIRLKLAATRQRILLGIRDNGVGIRARKHPGRGMGLHVMQYRADAIRGSLIVQKHPHGGTEVVCTVKRQALLPSDQEIK